MEQVVKHSRLIGSCGMAEASKLVVGVPIFNLSFLPQRALKQKVLDKKPWTARDHRVLAFGIIAHSMSYSAHGKAVTLDGSQLILALGATTKLK